MVFQWRGYINGGVLKLQGLLHCLHIHGAVLPKTVSHYKCVVHYEQMVCVPEKLEVGPSEK